MSVAARLWKPGPSHREAVVRLRPVAVMLLALLAAVQMSAQVVISEIMYHPVEEPAFTADGLPALDLSEDVHEYLELHNTGGNEVSLAGWQLTDGIQFTFPAGATLAPGGFSVVARNKARLAAVTAYQLNEATLFGPYDGGLSNSGETITLRNPSGAVVDSVAYSGSSPWPIGANALGAGERWTKIPPLDHQYRGRSLERVSFRHSGNDPANWVASPLAGEPSPGRPNAVRLERPFPAALRVQALQANDPQPVIRSNQAVRIDVTFSATNGLGRVRLEYFLENVNATNEAATNVAMTVTGDPAAGRFAGTIPPLPARSIVRYRLLAERVPDGGPLFEEVVYPRADDPFGWHSYFVSPVRSGTRDVYDLFVSVASMSRLGINLQDNPKEGFLSPPGTLPNARWNLTEPGVLVLNGEVRDIQVRHSGSYWRRAPGRNTFKVELPRYAPLNGQFTLLLTDKEDENAVGHAIFAHADLPTVRTRRVDLFINNGAQRFNRLEFEEHDDTLLERFHQEQARLHPDAPAEPAGQIFKSSGYADAGPYGPGTGVPLQTNAGWTPLQRYEWVYSSKNQDWQGYVPLKDMIEGLWAARGNDPNANLPALREFLAAHWDVEKTLTYLALRNWNSPWDDSNHNYFLWRQASGRWAMLPWDFDSEMREVTQTIFAGEGGNTFKDSFLKAFREEFKARLFWLNNTLLHPDNLASLQLSNASVIAFARIRQTNVNAQCGLGTFDRPDRPMNLFPIGGESVVAPASFQATPYARSPAPAHATTVWSLRAADGTHRFPIFTLTSSNLLTTLPIPFDQLELGKTYYWRCTYLDAAGRPSVPSEETPFRYGGSFKRFNLVTLDPGTVWKYHAPSTNLGSAWRQPAYDDGAWAAGPALLGQSSGMLPAPLRTPIDLGPRTFYFRQRFQFPASPAGASLRLFHVVDDGAVFYLNGVEVLRVNLPNGIPLGGISWTTLATQTVGDPKLDGPFTITATNLVAGENVLAAQVHQAQTDSPDVVLGAVIEATFAVPVPEVRLNEIMADNRTAVLNAGRFTDWIELHNPSSQPVSLAGVSLTDDLLAPRKYVFPPETAISAGGFLVAWCDSAFTAPGLHTGFGLNAQGETIALFAQTTNGLLALDSVNYGWQLTDRAIGRVPEGAGPWRLTVPTPNASNVPQPVGDSRQVRINEWLANPDNGGDWIELFNPEVLPVDLGGLYLTDSLANPTRSRIPALSFIDGGGFRKFVADGDLSRGADHLSFGLSETGEGIGLFSTPTLEIDSVWFDLQARGVSQGRQVDGSYPFVNYSQGGTPGVSNARDTDGDGLPDAWETTHGLNPALFIDASQDADGDGHSNLQEYQAGTDPRDNTSQLRIEIVGWQASGPGSVRLRFNAAPGRWYAVEYRDSPGATTWQTLGAVPASATEDTVELSDTQTSTSPTRYYRLVSRK